MPEKLHWKKLAKRLKTVPQKGIADLSGDPVCRSLSDESPADIALALEELTTAQAISIFLTLGQPVASQLLSVLEPGLSKKILAELPADNLAAVLSSLPPRDAANLILEAPRKQINAFLKHQQSRPIVVHEVTLRLDYPKGSAGRLMTTQYISLHSGTTVENAIGEIRKTDPGIDIPEDLYIVSSEKAQPSHHRLLGVISIRDLLMAGPKVKVDEIMAKKVIAIAGSAEEVDAAALMSKHKFMTLPVTGKNGFLIGVIPADDLMEVIVDRMRHQYARAVGTDAEAMERLTPFQEAKKRVPWLLGTMCIELLAGTVIAHFDDVLKKVILLASFMPVISAISGNVGLQAAAITVRAVDSGTSNRKNIWPSIRKEAATALLMALVCGVVLGAVGAVWSKHLPFGVVIGGALTCSMLTAGMMGTIIPVISKRLGFDPATTAGPFKTAFQDVVGFAVFLWLATMLQQWIS